VPNLIPSEVVEILLHCHRLYVCLLLCKAQQKTQKSNVHQEWSRWGDVSESLGGILGEVEPKTPGCLPFLAQIHLPLDQCHHLEVAHCIELDPLLLELVPHFELVGKLV
jgi:hypothetical protein